MLSLVTEWQTHCSRCGAELAPDVSTCGNCGEETERTLARDSIPGLLHYPMWNHAAVAVLMVAAAFGCLFSYDEPLWKVSAVTSVSLIVLSLIIGVLTAHLALPTNGFGVGLKFVTIASCALACVAVPTQNGIAVFSVMMIMASIVAFCGRFRIGLHGISSLAVIDGLRPPHRG